MIEAFLVSPASLCARFCQSATDQRRHFQRYLQPEAAKDLLDALGDGRDFRNRTGADCIPFFPAFRERYDRSSGIGRDRATASRATIGNFFSASMDGRIDN
jgi:hypothetical protein